MWEVELWQRETCFEIEDMRGFGFVGFGCWVGSRVVWGDGGELGGVLYRRLMCFGLRHGLAWWEWA